MKKILFILPMTVFAFVAFCQEMDTRTKIFKVSVAAITQNTYRGYLVDIEDSAVLFTWNAEMIRMKRVLKEDITSIGYENIELIVLRRKSSVGRGILFGSMIGLATGMVAGYAKGDDPACTADPSWFGLDQALCSAARLKAGEKAMLMGGAGVLAGAAAGAIIGAVAKKRFIIGGNKARFEEMRLSVLDRTYGNQKKIDALPEHP